MLATIWSNESWSEAMFLIAAILFAIATLSKLANKPIPFPLLEAGLTAVALGLLAL